MEEILSRITESIVNLIEKNKLLNTKIDSINPLPHKAEIEAINANIETIKEQIKKDLSNVSIKELFKEDLRMFLNAISLPKNGKDGKDAQIDYELIYSYILKQIQLIKWYNNEFRKMNTPKITL
jgi:hypothetical protein